MKYILSFFILALSSVVAAQDTASLDGASKPASSRKRLHQDMLLVDLNWDYLTGLKSPVKQKWYGRGVALSLMYDHPLNHNGNVSVAGGVGFASHNHYTNALVQKIDSLNVAGFMVQPGSIKNKGKISMNYVDVPVEFRFRTNEDNRGHRWKWAVGARVGYRIDAHEKIIDNTGYKMKLYQYPHTALFRYGPTIRFGYGAVMLTGFYSLSTFFQTGKGLQDLNAISVGITISPF